MRYNRTRYLQNYYPNPSRMVLITNPRIINNPIMAKIKHTPDIEEIIGSRGGLVERRKTFHDYDGNVTKVERLASRAGVR